MLDKLTIKGVNKSLDGEYDCDVITMLLAPGDANYLTYREWHRIKKISDVSAGNIGDALDSGDAAVTLAVAVVILERNGKMVDVDALWDAPGDSEIRFTIADRQPEEEEAPIPPVSEPLETPPTGSPQTNGGESSKSTSDSPENDPSHTGNPESDRSATSVPLTSVR